LSDSPVLRPTNAPKTLAFSTFLFIVMQQQQRLIIDPERSYPKAQIRALA
jgi:hypothetical protein